MRKISLVALCLLFTSHIATGYASCYDCEDDYTAQSFMFTRPLTQGLAIRQSAWHNIVHDRQGCMQSALQVTALGQQSMTDPRTAGYFLMKHKDMLTVMGDKVYGELNDPAAQRRVDLERDIRAEWLGLPDNFSGKFSIDPQQSQVGFVVEYNQMLKQWFDTGFFEYMWIDIQVPIVSVENKIHFKQFDIFGAPTTGEGPKDIIEAFNQKEWRHGKISDRKRSKIGVENIRFSFGSNYMSDGNFQLAYYSHWSFPATGSDPAHYMFDAVLGSNGHIGMGAGVNVQFVLNKPNCGYDVCFYLDLEHTFMICADQKRTVDLYGKPWSRYMQFVSYEQGPNVTIPGVNVLTQKFTVRPYSMVDGGFGLRINKSTFELESGYSIWGRSNEKLDGLVCPFEPIYGIAYPAALTDYKPSTASSSTIDKLGAQDKDSSDSPTFIPIKTSDFDLESGISRSVINHRFHVALSKLHKGTNVDGTFCIGAFYEVPQYNSGLNMWGVWGKIGTAF